MRRQEHTQPNDIRPISGLPVRPTRSHSAPFQLQARERFPQQGRSATASRTVNRVLRSRHATLILRLSPRRLCPRSRLPRGPMAPHRVTAAAVAQWSRTWMRTPQCQAQMQCPTAHGCSAAQGRHGMQASARGAWCGAAVAGRQAGRQADRQTDRYTRHSCVHRPRGLLGRHSPRLSAAGTTQCQGARLGILCNGPVRAIPPHRPPQRTLPSRLGGQSLAACRRLQRPAHLASHRDRLA